MLKHLFAVLIVTLLATRIASAQGEVVWVQIEAHPSLVTAQERARSYAANLPDVHGFSLGNGWYALALGPYTRANADQVLSVYRAERAIPGDSYIAFTRSFRQQFWPIGENILAAPPIATPAEGLTEARPQPETAADATPAPDAQPPAADAAADTATLPQPEPDETLREARASEATLDRAAREELQIALKWAGFYDAGIDGAFGPGTRRGMADWQTAQGLEPTGVLTTRQRAALLRQYNAVLDGLGLEMLSDAEAGITLPMPTAIVGFEKYDYPFAHYTATGDLPATVLLISQAGDRSTLHGLYDVMQTLAIVPAEGPRRRDNTSFVLVGEGGDFVSHTEVTLAEGEIKGFTLVWPAGDEARRTRLLGEMRKGLSRSPGTLDPGQIGEAQRVDLVAGLEIRKPRQARSGFFIDGAGRVVTTTEAIAGCREITLDDTVAATLDARDDALGIAVLTPATPLAPLGVARLQTATPRLQADVALGGYPYGGLLGAPSVTFGTLADLRGLDGAEGISRLQMRVLPGDAGGPVLDAGGAVLGMLLPRPGPDSGRSLPAEVNFALSAGPLAEALTGLGIGFEATGTTTTLPPEHLETRAVDMTVLVQCWD